MYIDTYVTSESEASHPKRVGRVIMRVMPIYDMLAGYSFINRDAADAGSYI